MDILPQKESKNTVMREIDITKRLSYLVSLRMSILEFFFLYSLSAGFLIVEMVFCDLPM